MVKRLVKWLNTDHTSLAWGYAMIACILMRFQLRPPAYVNMGISLLIVVGQFVWQVFLHPRYVRRAELNTAKVKEEHVKPATRGLRGYLPTGEVRPPLQGEWYTGFDEAPHLAEFDHETVSYPILLFVNNDYDEILYDRRVRAAAERAKYADTAGEQGHP